MNVYFLLICQWGGAVLHALIIQIVFSLNFKSIIHHFLALKSPEPSFTVALPCFTWQSSLTDLPLNLLNEFGFFWGNVTSFQTAGYVFINSLTLKLMSAIEAKDSPFVLFFGLDVVLWWNVSALKKNSFWHSFHTNIPVIFNCCLIYQFIYIIFNMRWNHCNIFSNC